jgi:hypothetical protein
VPPDAAGLDEEPVAGLDELAADELDVLDVVELDEFELQAARAAVAATGIAIASASFLARLRCISLYPFNLRPNGSVCRGWRCVVGGAVLWVAVRQAGGPGMSG